MLSQEDKSRIREEMQLREEIRRELSPPQHPKSGFQRVMAGLNSPFVVAFLGSVAIAFLGTYFQSSFAAYERELARAQAIQDQKIDLLGSFCDDFESATMVLASLQNAKIRRSATKAKFDRTDESSPDDKKLREDLQATYKELQEEYVDLWSKYFQQRKPKALFAQIESLFDDKNGAIAAAIKELDDAVNELHDFGDQKHLPEQVEQDVEHVFELGERIDKLAAHLASAMGDELRATRPSTESPSGPPHQLISPATGAAFGSG